jgi:1-acyl-sn-glycerol-3-phosphate acyltransferase
MSQQGSDTGRRLSGLSARWRDATGDGPLDAAAHRLGPLVRGVARRSRPRTLSGFPFTAPTWPSSIDPDPEPSSLGIDYDTDWARRPIARSARRALMGGVVGPGIRFLASPRVEGLDRIEGLEGPVVFAANHASHVDTFLVLSCVPERFRRRVVVAAGADYFFDKRWKATISALAISAVPIERHRVNRKSADQLIDLLRRDWSVVIFPEGSRSPDGFGTDFKPGAAFLAVRCGCPVVPIHLEGADRVLPKGAGRPTRGDTTVTFGHPLRAGEGEDARALNDRIEAAVAQLADEQANGWWAARRAAASGATPSLQGPAGVAPWRRQWERSGRDERRTPPRRSWP